MRRQTGISLVELLISIVLGLILITGVVQVFVTSKTTFTVQQAMSRIQETGRLAIEFISRDVRMAGYYGCVRPVDPESDVGNGNMVVGGLHRDFYEGVRGYDEDDDLPNGASADLGSMTLLPDTNVANILVLRSANKKGVPISSANDSGNLYGYTEESDVAGDCADGICKDAAMVASDCTKVRVFQVSDISINDASDQITISHADVWGGGVNPLENFTTGEVIPINTIVYFLAEGASGQPTLWQRINTAAAVELLEGVEQMRVTYATSSNTSYRPASALGAEEWELVNSVRVELVVRSLENSIVEDPQPYVFNGATVTPAAGDKYLRQVFSTTMGIRSRAVLN